MRKRYRQVLSFVLIIHVNGLCMLPRRYFVVLRSGLCMWADENVVVTMRLSAIYFEDREMKR